MAAAALVTSKITSAVSNPLHVVSSTMVVNSDSPTAPAAYTSPSTSSRPVPTSPSTSRHPPSAVQVMPPYSSESAPKTFKRLLRSPFEPTIRSTTRSKGKPTPLQPDLDDEFATITAKRDMHADDESPQVKVTEVMAREGRERIGMLKRFETKVALGRTRKESSTKNTVEEKDRLASQTGKDQHRFRLAGFTSFVTPSLTHASLSSPALHLPDHHHPSSNRPLISPPAPLTPKHPSVPNVNSPAPSRPRKSRPDPLLPPSPSTPSLERYTLSSSPTPTTPTRPASRREPVSPPATPTPTPSSPLGKRSSAGTARSSLDQSFSSPSSSRQKSPNSSRTCSPPSSRIVTPRGFTSVSTSSLNYPPSYSSNAIRRSSVERGSPLPRASSPASPSRSRALSPAHQRQRTVSPSTPLTRHTNGSATSLSPVSPSNPMHREAVRVATSMLCKEMLRPGQSIGLGVRESEEVEVRMRALARLERVWQKSGASTNGSATQVGVSASTAGEERERRLFTEALRDGYVLCL